MGFQLLYGAALLGASVQAFAFLPRPTDPLLALPLEDGWSPRPTQAPDAHVFRRQISLPSSYLIAPDNTCGFINGNSKSAYACLEDDARCAIIPTSGKVPGAIGCCSGSNCNFRISCVDKSEMGDCDKNCQNNNLTLKCTDTAKYCNTVVFPGGVTDYYCGAKKTSVLKAQTAASGDKSRSMSEVKPTSTTTTSSKASSSSTSKNTSSSSDSSSSSESSTETASETSSDIPASGTEPPVTSSATDANRAGAATSSTPPVATAAPPSTPVGAIVGGIIGGIALIALSIFGAIFLRQHKKKSLGMAELPPPQPFMAEPTFPSTQPPAAPYAQDTASSRVTGYPPSSATATPAHMYGVPAAAAAGVGAGAAGAAAFNSYHNHHPSNHTSNYPDYANSSNNSNPNNPYADPSPLTTPGGSPQPQYAHQMHAPPPLPAPSYYNHSPHQSQDNSHNNNGNSNNYRGDGAWAGAETPDRRSTSTPVSTYNGTTPVSPASALGPMPGESQGQGQGGGGGSGSGSGGSGVPLSLQPGMGYRPYRPPGGGGSSSTASLGAGNIGVAAVAMVVPRKAVSTSTSASPASSPSMQQGQGPGQGQGAVASGNQQTAAVELP